MKYKDSLVGSQRTERKKDCEINGGDSIYSLMILLSLDGIKKGLPVSSDVRDSILESINHSRPIEIEPIILRKSFFSLYIIK